MRPLTERDGVRSWNRVSCANSPAQGTGRRAVPDELSLGVRDWTNPLTGRAGPFDRMTVMSVLDSFRLDDKVVIVTGASSGLGVSFAQACAAANLIFVGLHAGRMGSAPSFSFFFSG